MITWRRRRRRRRRRGRIHLRLIHLHKAYQTLTQH